TGGLRGMAGVERSDGRPDSSRLTAIRPSPTSRRSLLTSSNWTAFSRYPLKNARSHSSVSAQLGYDLFCCGSEVGQALLDHILDRTGRSRPDDVDGTVHATAVLQRHRNASETIGCLRAIGATNETRVT